MNIKDFIKEKKLALILIFIYLILLYTLQFIANDGTLNMLFFAVICVLSALSSFAVVYFLYDPVTKLKFNGDDAIDSSLSRYNIKTVQKIVGFAIFFVTLIIFTMYLLAQYPGGMNTDISVQYAQGIGATPYNNWHPAIHTILFYTIPLKIKQTLGFVVFWQILWFSCAFGYLCYVLYKNAMPKMLLAFLCIFVWCNPFLARLMMCAWKDIALTIFAVVVMAYYIEIFCSKGEWLKNIGHVVLFSLSIALCTCMRHNAVLFTVPILLIVIFYIVKEKKVRMLITVGFIAFYAAVWLLYAALSVEKGTGATLQKVGVPITIWCNVMQKSPEVLPGEMQDYMYSIATADSYVNVYVPGNFNSLRFYDKIDLFSIDELDWGTIIKYTCYCFTKAPGASFEALAKLTSVVWGVDGAYMPVSANIEDNEWGYTKSPIQFEGLNSQLYTFFMMGAGKIIFGSIGLMLLIIYVFAAILLSNKRMSFIHALPILCYDFGTMLFLNGGDYRFFMLTLPIWIAILFIMIKDENPLPSRPDRGSSVA